MITLVLANIANCELFFDCEEIVNGEIAILKPKQTYSQNLHTINPFQWTHQPVMAKTFFFFFFFLIKKKKMRHFFCVIHQTKKKKNGPKRSWRNIFR